MKRPHDPRKIPGTQPVTQTQAAVILGTSIVAAAPDAIDGLVARAAARLLDLDIVPPTTGYMLLSGVADLVLGEKSTAAGVARGMLCHRLARMGATLGSNLTSKQPPPDNVRDFSSRRKEGT